MANRRQNTAYRRRVNSNRRSEQYNKLRETYEDGNAVRVPDYEVEEEKAREAEPRVSEHIRRNRERSTSMGPGYVFFLTLVCAVAVFFCIHYLQLRSEYTTQMETIASMENTLSKLEADNDAYYKEAMASVTIEDVRDTALNKLGMHYASESQIEYYDSDNESYVRQYESVDNN